MHAGEGDFRNAGTEKALWHSIRIRGGRTLGMQEHGAPAQETRHVNEAAAPVRTHEDRAARAGSSPRCGVTVASTQGSGSRARDGDCSRKEAGPCDHAQPDRYKYKSDNTARLRLRLRERTS